MLEKLSYRVFVGLLVVVVAITLVLQTNYHSSFSKGLLYTLYALVMGFVFTIFFEFGRKYLFKKKTKSLFRSFSTTIMLCCFLTAPKTFQSIDQNNNLITEVKKLVLSSTEETSSLPYSTEKYGSSNFILEVIRTKTLLDKKDLGRYNAELDKAFAIIQSSDDFCDSKKIIETIKQLEKASVCLDEIQSLINRRTREFSQVVQNTKGKQSIKAEFLEGINKALPRNEQSNNEFFDATRNLLKANIEYYSFLLEKKYTFHIKNHVLIFIRNEDNSQYNSYLQNIGQRGKELNELIKNHEKLIESL